MRIAGVNSGWIVKSDLTAVQALTWKIRALVAFFILALVISGLTAFPLAHELNLLVSLMGIDSNHPVTPGGLPWWILHVQEGLRVTYERYPFVAYGTDWLAFAHLVIAVYFLGPLFNPVRNIWVLKAGLVSCVAVIPLALICGPLRGIPFYWRVIDCSFGVFGALPLWWALRLTRALERLEKAK